MSSTSIHLLSYALILAPRIHTSNAFTFTPFKIHNTPPHITTTASFSSAIPVETVTTTKTNVLDVAKTVFQSSKTGLFITDPSATKDLKKAVAELEAVCDPPGDNERKLMMGDWKLVCTTNFPSSGGEFKIGDGKGSGPFGLPIPEPPEFLSKTRNKLIESVEVTQRIRAFDWDNEKTDETYVAGEGKMSSKFNRIDNIVEFTPFTLESILNVTLNLNPLEVSKTKVTLAHKAEVLSLTPVLRTKLALASVILNVAGETQYLEPTGADVLALNVPLGDFLNAGAFDTTYVDDDIRISRGKVGLVEQLRVFTRKPVETEVIAEVKEDAIEDVIGDVEVKDAVVESKLEEEEVEEVVVEAEEEIEVVEEEEEEAEAKEKEEGEEEAEEEKK